MWKVSECIREHWWQRWCRFYQVLSRYLLIVGAKKENTMLRWTFLQLRDWRRVRFHNTTWPEAIRWHLRPKIEMFVYFLSRISRKVKFLSQMKWNTIEFWWLTTRDRASCMYKLWSCQPWLKKFLFIDTNQKKSKDALKNLNYSKWCHAWNYGGPLPVTFVMAGDLNSRIHVANRPATHSGTKLHPNNISRFLKK